jgi:hypothetical protein
MRLNSGSFRFDWKVDLWQSCEANGHQASLHDDRAFVRERTSLKRPRGGTFAHELEYRRDQ